MKRFAVLGSRTSLKHYQKLPGFHGGVHMGTAAEDLPLAIESLSGVIDTLYIEEKPHFLSHARTGLGANSALPLVLYKLDAQGLPSSERIATMRDVLPMAAPGDGRLETRVAAEVERTLNRILGSVDFQRKIGAAVMQAQRDILNDISYLLNIRTGLASADFVLKNVPLYLLKPSQQDLRRDAVLAAPENGLFLEFGVWKGRWLKFLAGERAVPFYGFDSFEGLPEPWSIRPVGTFDLKGEMPVMPANVTLVKGWFEDTLEPFLAQRPNELVSYIDMDCDIYSATYYVLEMLKSRLRVGTVILLDDFMIRPGWEHAEHKAFMDFVRKYGVTFDYTGYCSMSASVVLTGLGRLAAAGKRPSGKRPPRHPVRRRQKRA